MTREDVLGMVFLTILFAVFAFFIYVSYANFQSNSKCDETCRPNTVINCEKDYWSRYKASWCQTAIDKAERR